MRANWEMRTADEPGKGLEQPPQPLGRDHESVAGGLRVGMGKPFALARLQISASLHRSLATTNVIQSPQSGVRRRTH